MYHLIDMNTRKTIYNAMNKQDLLLYWANRLSLVDRKGKLDFHELNVTGKDMLKETVRTGSYFLLCGRAFPTFQQQTRLRRYMVKDDQGHSCDIRTWVDGIRFPITKYYGTSLHTCEPANLPEYRRAPALQGRKPHYHRMAHPAMTHRTLRDYYSVMDMDMDYDDLIMSSDIPPIRNRGITRYTTFDLAEDKYFGRRSRSWKENSKSRKQWGKHKHMNNHASIRYFYAGMTLEDILQGIAADDCAS